MPVDTVITTFESNSQRIVWLPSVTLAYLFTITGNISQFMLAVAAIGGAQWFIILINTDFDSNENAELSVSWIQGNFSRLVTTPLAILSAVYAFAVVYALRELYKQFRHEDIVLVGLGIIWCGIAIVILVNIIALAANIDEKTSS